MMKHVFLGLALGWCGSAWAQEAPSGKDAQGFEWDCPSMGYLPYRRDLLVPTEDLGRMMEEGALVLLHVGFDETADPPQRRIRYSEAHLPGARSLSWSDLAGSGSDVVALGSHARLFASLGVSPESRVVFYDTGEGREAAVAYAALDAVGFGGRAMLLDGQFSKWAFEGRPITTNPPRTRSGVIEPCPACVGISPDVVGLLWEGRDHGSSDVTLIDARQHRGGDAKRNARWNHVPRMSWTEALVSPNYPVIAPEARLRRVWSEVPSQPDWTVIVAGRRWTEAAPVYFLAKLLGYHARILDGSIDSVEGLERGNGEDPS